MKTPDKAASQVTTETVMLAILEHIHADPERGFTTLDIALDMGANEYPVRAAFHWLRRLGKIEIARGARVERHNRTEGKAYSVRVYRLKAKSATPAAFDALYRVFGLGTAPA